jgi:hypothetical protein
VNSFPQVGLPHGMQSEEAWHLKSH